MADQRMPPNDPETAPPVLDPNRTTWRDWAIAGLIAASGLAIQYLRGGTPRQAEPSPTRSTEEEESLPEEIHLPGGAIEHPRVRREKSDLAASWVFVILVAAVCIAAVHYYLVWRMYWYETAAQREEKRSPYAALPPPSTRLPPEPRLEQLDRLAGIESSNVYWRLAAKEWALHRYGLAEESGFVHIPIEQAMRIAAGELPVRPARKPRRHDRGLVDWGESNSGRMFRGE